MLWRVWVSVLAVITLTYSVISSGTAGQGGNSSGDAAVALANLPSVVIVDVEFKLPLRHVPSTQSLGARGSGFIVDKGGYILTANHLLEWVTTNSPRRPADKITVTFYDGSKAEAKIAAADRQNDLAILKVEKRELKLVTLGDPSTLKPGMSLSWVYYKVKVNAPTVSQGTLTSVNKQIGPKTNLLELTGKFDVGGGGSVVLDSSGKAVGMIIGMLSPSAASKSQDSGKSRGLAEKPPVMYATTAYAVPVNQVKTLLETLKTKQTR